MTYFPIKKIYLIIFGLFFFFSHLFPVACGILVPIPGTESVLPIVEVQGLNHWTTRKIPGLLIFFCQCICVFVYFPVAYSLEVMTNLDSILKCRDITLSTKFHLVKAMVFPVVMYGCESWTVKKAEHRSIDAFTSSVGEDSWKSLGLQRDPSSPS